MLSQIRGGALGLKLHQDLGSTPAVIDAALTVADRTGIQVAIHTDTLNEAGFVGDTLAAIAGRADRPAAYHTEGAGGLHARIMTVVSEPHVLPSSTNPTRPYTVKTAEEHLDMLMVCHHLNAAVPEDLAFAESRIRPSTIGAEDVLDHLGAISIISSDAQAMGRVGEVIMRTWQTAHVMKRRRGALPGDGRADNHRVRRYVAKYTINPALAQGLALRSAPSRPASWPTSCLWYGSSGRTSSIKGGRSRTRRWATPTRPSRHRSHPAPADVRGDRTGTRLELVQLRGAARHRGRTAGAALAGEAVGGDRVDAWATKADMRENVSPGRTGRSRQLRRGIRRGAGGRPPRPPNFPRPSVTSSSTSRAALLVLADGRFPAGGHHRRGRGGGQGRRDQRGVEPGGLLPGRTWRAADRLPGGGGRARGRSALLDSAADARTPSPALRVAARRLTGSDAGGSGDLAVRELDALARAFPKGAHQPVVLVYGAGRLGRAPARWRTAPRTRASASPPCTCAVAEP